jgi:hypothetical protein
MLLPFLNDAVPKMPTAFITAFFDAVRYGIHHFPPIVFRSLLKWCVTKVQGKKIRLCQYFDKTYQVNVNLCNTLVSTFSGTWWQHETGKEEVDVSGKLANRFTLQSKYLLLTQDVLIKLVSEDDVGAACQRPWYTSLLVSQKEGPPGCRSSYDMKAAEAELGLSLKYVSKSLIPYLLNAIGHLYEKCRDHIASCLFGMSYCHRKFKTDVPKELTAEESQNATSKGKNVLPISKVRLFPMGRP